MKIFVKNKGKIELDKRHYITSGGEGKIFVRGNTAYKIYLKKSHVISEGKIKELSVLTLPNIIKPLNVVFNEKNKNIGYSMKYIDDTVSLCKLFTKAFKDRNKIDQDSILKLVSNLYDIVKHCHSKNILIVDLNELNFLVDGTKFKNIYSIDVDSYQTPTYKASAIMDSIRDRHTDKWSEKTDWFSFGIISFQMLIGVHPYKGKHPKYKTLDERMKNNISVFNKDVRLPPVALALDILPENYKQWYKAIFEKGARLFPPLTAVPVIIIPTRIKTIEGTDNFIINFLREYDGDIIDCVNESVILTTSGLYVNKKLDEKVAPYSQISCSFKFNRYISAIVKNKKLLLYNVSTGKDIECIPINVDKLISYKSGSQSIIYAKHDDSISEIEFIEISATEVHVGLRLICNILPRATKMYDGLIIQNLLDAYFISIFPESKLHYQIKIDELKDYRIIDAKYSNRILVVIAEIKGKYDCFIIKINESYNGYSIRIEKSINYLSINFIVIDNGICIRETADNYIELSYNKFGLDDIKIIKDMTLAGGKFFQDGNKVLFAKSNKLYDIKMK